MAAEIPIPTAIGKSLNEQEIEESAYKESIFERTSVSWLKIFHSLRKGTLSEDDLSRLLYGCLLKYNDDNALTDNTILTHSMVENSVFTYDYRDEAKYRILKQITTSYVLPPLNVLSIKYFPCNSPMMKCLLYKCMNEVGSLFVNNQSKFSHLLQVGYYIDAFVDAMKWVT